jgi:DNA-binding NarL/FixJ family response regulator
MIKVLIVDDHQMVIEGLKMMLSDSEEIDIVGTAVNAYEAIAFLKENEVEVALLDINLPDLSGIDLCLKIKEEYPQVKSLALSTFAERSYISKMIQNGAMGYLIKSSLKSEIIEAIKRVHKGGFFMNVNLLDTYTKTDSKNIPFLTRREKEVLELIAEGLTNQHIADKIFVSVLTVNSHRTNLLAKFNVNNTASLIKVAAQNGLV